MFLLSMYRYTDTLQMIYKYDNWDLTIAEFTCKNKQIFVYKYKYIAIGDPVIKKGELGCH